MLFRSQCDFSGRLTRHGGDCIKGAEFKATNYSANVADDKYSPEGNIICNWVGGSGSDMAVYGGSKVPGMP